MQPLFDAHCHIDSGYRTENLPDGSGGDAAAVFGRLACGVGPGDWAAVAAAAAVWPGTTPAYGLHPWHVGENTGKDWTGLLEARLGADANAWLGEAGLDGLKTDAARQETQERVFREQLRLARRLDRRVNLHCVKAWDPFLSALDAEYLDANAGRPFIIHSFAGPHQYIDKLAGRGAYFTVGPLFSRRDSSRDRARCALIPEDRLLLESDAFLRPGCDAAAGLEHTLNWLAAARGCDPAALAAVIAATSRRIFNNE